MHATRILRANRVRIRVCRVFSASLELSGREGCMVVQEKSRSHTALVFSSAVNRFYLTTSRSRSPPRFIPPLSRPTRVSAQAARTRTHNESAPPTTPVKLLHNIPVPYFHRLTLLPLLGFPFFTSGCETFAFGGPFLTYERPLSINGFLPLV